MGEAEEKPPEITQPAKRIRLVQSLLADASSLPHQDYKTLDALLGRVEMIIAKIFGASSVYLRKLEEIQFDAGHYYTGMPVDAHDRAWKFGNAKLTNLLTTMLEDLELSQHDQLEANQVPPQTKAQAKPMSNRVFVVHGHDSEMKLAVARLLEQLGLEPIILHEKPDLGRTVIEKFIDYSDVGFAVVLLSPDDLAYAKGSEPTSARPRARQNVILELGFFAGKLGRERVVALHRVVPDFEMPSDYAGVLYKPFDDAGIWRIELVRELEANGYAVDAKKII